MFFISLKFLWSFKGVFVLNLKKKKLIMKHKLYIYLKKLKINFLKVILFNFYKKKLKTDFFEILMILKKLSKYMKIDFFN